LPVSTGKADIICFSRPWQGKPEDNKPNCSFVLESKGFSIGLDYAKDQGQRYTQNFPNCKKVVLSNGYCYKVIEKLDDGEWKPSAYLNILSPKTRYPLDPENVDGALEALRLMLP